jgi:hypothetical protein
VSPIRPENRSRYPADWRTISARIRFVRALGRCECTGQCATRGNHERACALVDGDDRCTAAHGQANPRTGSVVVLTTMHLDDTPENCADENLLAGCQACHLAYDRNTHAANLTRTHSLRRSGGTADLFDGAA